MINYPKTAQLRDVVRQVKTNHDFKGIDSDGNPIYVHTTPYPKLDFKGSVKIHGTNAGIVKYKDRVEFQSRNNVITKDNDNAGFARYYSYKNLDYIFSKFSFNDYVAIYGEWAGRGIQKGVSVSEIDRIFVIFAIFVDGEWEKVPEDLYDFEYNIYNKNMFKNFMVTIDFNSPEDSLEEIKNMTLSVEDECPVGKYFGISGVGEGIVFCCDDNEGLKFKSKGEKHSVSKTKNVSNIDVEKINSVKEFVEYAVTENRLNQGIEFLKETNADLSQKTTGIFLSWVFKDIIEEESDTLEQNGLSKKDVSTQIANKARNWYFEQINKI